MKRLDVFLAENGDIASREKAKNLILEGKVKVNGNLVLKPSFLVVGDENIEVWKNEFVSRGAYKIKTAFEKFDFSFEDKTILDIGASTGGFTQFALLNGAKKVYALDVGQGELAEELKNDERVVNLEGLDFRDLKKGELNDVNLIIGDLSFISLKHIFPKIIENFGKNMEIVMLFKPQFECGREIAKRYKGVVLDKNLHKKLLEDFVEYIKSWGLEFTNLTYSQITGKEGNIEYLFHLNGKNSKNFDIAKIVEEAHNLKK